VYPAVFVKYSISDAVILWRLLLSWSNFQYSITKLEGIMYCVAVFLVFLKFSVV
jgi:hypothetical protein